MKKRVAVLISGSGSNLQALIDAAQAPDYPAQIALVISNNGAAFGLERAKKAGIPTEVIDHRAYSDRAAFDLALHELLVKYETEIVCLAGFMRILTQEFVHRWEGRMLNIHPSLLPAYKGLHTHARALEAKEQTVGCTVHFVTAELDDGPAILQQEVPVHEGDTPEILAARVLVAEHQCYPKALSMVASGQ